MTGSGARRGWGKEERNPTTLGIPRRLRVRPTESAVAPGSGRARGAQAASRHDPQSSPRRRKRHPDAR
jgi:hypothetical protein